MSKFEQYLNESDFNKYKGTYNWYNEIILKDEYSSAKSEAAAHRNFCAKIAKKTGKSVPSVVAYYKNNPNRFKIVKG